MLPFTNAYKLPVSWITTSCRDSIHQKTGLVRPSITQQETHWSFIQTVMIKCLLDAFSEALVVRVRVETWKLLRFQVRHALEALLAYQEKVGLRTTLRRWSLTSTGLYCPCNQCPLWRVDVDVDNIFNWSVITDGLSRKEQSCLYFLSRLESFNICNNRCRCLISLWWPSSSYMLRFAGEAALKMRMLGDMVVRRAGSGGERRTQN